MEDWLVTKRGFFVKHNVRFRPAHHHAEYNSKQDSVHSDIDIIAINSKAQGIDRVHVVTCKSWQNGFRVKQWLKVLEAEATYHDRQSSFQPREGWKSFRELVSDKWMEAFIELIEQETGQRDFTYYIAVTKIIGRNEDRIALESSELLINRFANKYSKVKLKIITLGEMIEEYHQRIELKSTPSLESTNVGRMLQLMHAAGLQVVSRGTRNKM